MKLLFGLFFFLLFWRLQIYEAIAAIFWRSAGYVFILKENDLSLFMIFFFAFESILCRIAEV